MSTPQIPIDSGFGLAATTAFAANAVILFLYGLTVAPAYYLPMIVFSIEFGGKHCGVLIGLIDAAAQRSQLAPVRAHPEHSTAS